MPTSRKTLLQHFETIFDLNNLSDEEKDILGNVSSRFNDNLPPYPSLPDNKISFFINECRELTPKYMGLLFSNLYGLYAKRIGSYSCRVMLLQTNGAGFLPYSDDFHEAAKSAWLWGKILLPFFNRQEIRNLTSDHIVKFKKDKKDIENYGKEKVDSVYFKNLKTWYGFLEDTINLLQAIKVIEEQFNGYPSETVETFHAKLSIYLDSLKHCLLHYDYYDVDGNYYPTTITTIENNILSVLIEASITLKQPLTACFDSLIATGLYNETRYVETSIKILSNKIQLISDNSLPTLLNLKNHFLNHTLSVLNQAAQKPADTSVMTELFKEIKKVKEFEEKNAQVSKETTKFRSQLTMIIEISLAVLVLAFIPLALLGGLPLLIPIAVISCTPAILLAGTYLFAPQYMDNTISDNLSKFAHDLNPDFCQNTKNVSSPSFFKQCLFSSEESPLYQPQMTGK